MTNIKTLNREQMEAIEYNGGPLLIIAGAGTGKTTVVTERIKNLILKKHIPASQILALTFTDKASREMEERIDVEMPYGYTQMWISTFHSFCDRVLRSEAVHIGLTPSYRLMTEAETLLFIRSHIFQFKLDYFRPLGNPNKFLEGMLQHFSRLKDEDVSSNEYLSWTQAQNSKIDPGEIKKDLELANAFKIYEDLKAKEGVMDFSDLISNTLKLFRTRKNILKSYQDQFQYILVDEFQDTNFAQNQLAILLGGEKKNITVVGDDDQCLPGDTLISTPNGKKKIKEIKKGDEVLSGVGKGSVGTYKVSHIVKSKKKTTFITITTKLGKQITATDNHKMFCYVPKFVREKNFYYVYLMYRKNLGWRIGTTNDLAVRLKLERSSDAIIGLRAFDSEQEARYHELLWSLKYQIPTCIFKERDGVMLQGKYVKRIYEEFDTNAGAHRLAQDLRINLENYHYILDAVTRGQSRRIKINLYLCYRKYTPKHSFGRLLKNPSILHAVHLETSNPYVIQKLQNHKIHIEKAKKGIRVRFVSADIEKVGSFAKRLSDITGGFIEAKATMGKFNFVHLPALIIPAGNLLEGLYVPVLSNKMVYYDQIINIKREEKEEIVYDLEVERTHNFIANNIVVHNSIYRFRGSSVSNIIQFKKQFPKAKIVTLTTNYRSTQEILDKAYTLIQYNNPDRLEAKEKVDKKLKTQRKVKSYPIEILYTDRVEDEADNVAKKIIDLVNNDNRFYKDIAILVRANDHATAFVKALQRYKIPFQFLGPGRLFRQEEIKDLIAYLKVLYNFEDSISLYRILNLPVFDLEARDIAAILNFAKRKNFTLFESLEKITEASQAQDIILKNEVQEKIKKIVDMIKRHLKRVPTDSTGQILYYFLEDSGMLKQFLSAVRDVNTKKYQNIAKFFDKLKSFEIDNEDARVFPVVDWIDLSMQMGESPLAADIDWSENNAVNILTIHSSKGLEFPVVFLVNLVNQRFPTRERREQIPITQDLIKEILPEGDYHLQEERRLFYVGMTRARDRLYFTAANFYGEGKRDKKLSPFIYEALGQETITRLLEKQKAEKQVVQPSLLDWVAITNPKTNPQPTTNDQKLKTNITYISYSQIQTFNMCPLHYKLQYILKIPFRPTASLSFGSSIHAALKDFYQKYIENKNIKIKDIVSILKDRWIDEGYQSKTHQNEAFEKAKYILLQYLKTNFIPNANKPVGIEIPFQFFIKDAKADKISLKIGGRIDRVDNIGENKIEIIDYKTGGNIPKEKELDTNLQLTLYALAATQVKDNIFNKKPEDIILSLHYLGEEKKLTTTRTKDQLEEAKAKILEIVEEIEKSDFACSRSIICQNCEYKMLCNTS